MATAPCTLYDPHAGAIAVGWCHRQRWGADMLATTWHRRLQRGDGPFVLVTRSGAAYAVVVTQVASVGAGDAGAQRYRCCVLRPAPAPPAWGAWLRARLLRWCSLVGQACLSQTNGERR